MTALSGRISESNGRNTISFLGNQEEIQGVRDGTTLKEIEKKKLLFKMGKHFARSVSDYYICQINVYDNCDGDW